MMDLLAMPGKQTLGTDGELNEKRLRRIVALARS